MYNTNDFPQTMQLQTACINLCNTNKNATNKNWLLYASTTHIEYRKLCKACVCCQKNKNLTMLTIMVTQKENVREIGISINKDVYTHKYNRIELILCT